MLNWIEAHKLDEAIGRLLATALSAKEDASKRMSKNVVDPFSSLVLASVMGISSVKPLEGVQQLQSALSGMSNALGRFHEDVLSSVSGWDKHDRGYDIERVEKKILAEIKNKHNTMNASNKEKVVEELSTAVRQKPKGWRAYLVIIIPRTPERYQKLLREKREVYEIDGASFYEQVTDHPNALHDLHEVMSRALGCSAEIQDHCRSMLHRAFPDRR